MRAHGITLDTRSPFDSRQPPVPQGRRHPPCAPARGRPDPRAASRARDGAPRHRVRARDRRHDRPRRDSRRGRTGVLGGRPDLARGRQPVPPHRALPAVRLRAVDAAAVCALGAAAVGGGLVRVARRHDPPPAVVDPVGVRASAVADRDPRLHPRVPVRREPRYGQHQHPARADDLRGALHGAAAGRLPVGDRDLDEVGPRAAMARPATDGLVAGVSCSS